MKYLFLELTDGNIYYVENFLSLEEVDGECKVRWFNHMKASCTSYFWKRNIRTYWLEEF